MNPKTITFFLSVLFLCLPNLSLAQLVSNGFLVTQTVNEANSKIRIEDAELLRNRAIRNAKAKLSTDIEIERLKNAKYRDQIVVTTRGSTIGFADPGYYQFILRQDGKEVFRSKGNRSVANTPDVDGFWWDTSVLTLPTPIGKGAELVIVRTVVESSTDKFLIKKLTDAEMKAIREKETAERKARNEELEKNREWVSRSGAIRFGKLIRWENNVLTFHGGFSGDFKINVEDLDFESRKNALADFPESTTLVSAVKKILENSKPRRWRDSNKKTLVKSARVYEIREDRTVILIDAASKKTSIRLEKLSSRDQKSVTKLAEKILEKQKEVGLVFYGYKQRNSSYFEFEDIE